jgi:hypothetical protein
VHDIGRTSVGLVCALAIAAAGLIGASTAQAAAPTATTQAATAIAADGATLNGTVNPGGEATAYTFEYGTNLSFGNITTIEFTGNGNSAVPVTAPLTGLSPNTTYYYRLVATNGTSTSNGVVFAFTTSGPATPPSVTTGAASAIGAFTATLSGTVNPNGRQTAFTFEYGPSETFGHITAVDNAGSAGVVQPVTLPATGLTASTLYYYRLVATNADGTTWGPTLTFTTADDQPPTDISLSNSSVQENQPANTTVGTLSATDPDLGDSHTFTLVAGTGSDDNASFQISGSTLKTNAVFDFEAKSSYTIRVRATDLDNKTFEKQLTITITDIVENAAPTDITLSSASVAENQPVNTTVGTLAAVDPDAGNTHTFTLVAGDGSTDNASFNISGSSLRTSAVFNFEAKSSYAIRVRATDQGNLSTEKQFTISITNVNEAPVATNDSYTGAIGNTLASRGVTVSGEPVVALTGNVLTANDTDPDAGNTVTAVAETVSSTGGGIAEMRANGSFTYLPGVGDKNQNDTFTYHATDGTLQTAGTVTVGITNNLVWYVNRNAASNGDGRSTMPLQNLAGINGAGGSGDADGPSDVIFLYGSGTAYTGGLPLEASQILTGQPEGLTVNSVALVPAAGSNPVIQNAGGAGITLANGGTTRRVNVGTTSGDGITGSAITTADIGGSSTVSSSGGAGFKLTGAASGAITMAANIGATTGRKVDIQNRSGGTSTLSGTINGSGQGVFLNANTGATINFTGDIDVSTGTNPAFTATGGGTVSTSNTGSTLASTTGVALNVANTTIGSAGLKFTSIAANGAASGIVLNATGTTAGLTVSGTGAAPSGGTIQNTTGPGISLTDTDKVSLNNMAITGADRAGIKGTGVTDFSYTNGSIVNAGDTKNASAPFDGAFSFNQATSGVNNIDGVVTITGNTVTNPWGGGVDIANRSGTISDAVITGNNFTSATSFADSHEDGISLNFVGSTTAVASLTKATISNNTIQNFPGGHGITISGGNSASSSAPAGTYGTPGSATNVITISGNIIKGDPVTKFNGDGITAGVEGRGTGNFAITNNGTAGNPITNTAGHGIAFGNAGSVTADYVVTGNFIAPNNEFNSDGIAFATDKNTQADSSVLSNPVMNATVNNNTISNTDGGGIFGLNGNSNGTMRVKVQNNSIGKSSHQFGGVSINNGSSPDAAWNPTLCAAISGNTTATGTPDGFGDADPGIVLTKRSTSASTYVFGITGLTPSPATAAQTETYVAGQNPNSAFGAGFFASKKVAVISGSNFTSCTLPF